MIEERGFRDSNPSGGKSSRSNGHATFWRFAAVIVAALLLVLAVFLNNKHEDNSIARMNEALDIDQSDQEIVWDRYQSTDLHLSKTTTIDKAGVYYVSGTIDEGSLVIDVGDTVVKLVLDDVAIKNSEGPAIYCKSADDLVIELRGNNYLEDGGQYASDYDTEVTGTIFSKSDLTFEGNGSLNVTANFADGIVSKDDLKFRNGEYFIVARDDAIRGTDSVYVLDGDFTIDSMENAIKSTNETNPKKGFVLIDDGSFSITAQNKGIKGFNTVIINNGNIVLDTFDDAIHSDNFIGITSGVINISSGDDAIHANSQLLIDGGQINIVKSNEGLEAQAVTINGGSIKIIASDDGINAGGGNNDTNTQSKKDVFNIDEKCILTINGGEISVNASGDGIDSNGWLYFNGGKVDVDGPTDNGNGALDAGAGILMNSGEVMAVGSIGMAENLGSNSSVFNLSVFFDTLKPAGTEIEIKNSKDEIILSHTALKTFSHLAAGSQKLILGETYSIYLDGEEYQNFTITEVTTTLGDEEFYMFPPEDKNQK